MVAFILALWACFWLAMVAAWLFQRQVGNAGWIDVFWTFATGITGILAALFPVAGSAWPSARQVFLAVLVALWSLRLGLYMAIRVASSAEDLRYTQMRKEWGADFQRRLFWLAQNQGVGSIVLPVAVLAAAQNPARLRLADAVGIVILLVAITGEALADWQMRRFKAAGRGRLCDVGLWSWSRHPNYFFEWLGWCAYPVIAIDLSGPYP
jgi:steroid 5-alpha reductase family enzyme